MGCAEPLGDHRVERTERLDIRYVEAARDLEPERVCRCEQARLVDVADGNPSATLDERARGRVADASCAAGDDDDLVAK
ncbi:short-chain dehydrogenase/reductase family [Nocardioides sp. CF8]|nr:short-chain dehydrogenase/reductase family [Nocardioides sp. CF8]